MIEIVTPFFIYQYMAFGTCVKSDVLFVGGRYILYPGLASLLGIEKLRQCLNTWLLLEQALLKDFNWKVSLSPILSAFIFWSVPQLTISVRALPVLISTILNTHYQSLLANYQTF